MDECSLSNNKNNERIFVKIQSKCVIEFVVFVYYFFVETN